MFLGVNQISITNNYELVSLKFFYYYKYFDLTLYSQFRMIEKKLHVVAIELYDPNNKMQTFE